MALSLTLLLISSLALRCQSFLSSFKSDPRAGGDSLRRLKLFQKETCIPKQRLQKNLFPLFDNNAASDLKLEEEEILMKVSLSICETCTLDETLPFIQHYLESFPFSAVLPVQPLSYLPRGDGMGVNVSFLRKKTQEKSSYDGGIEFTIVVDDKDDTPTSRIDIVARRNSEGQYISKVFSEGMIVKAFVNGLNYGEKSENGGRVGLGYDELLERCSVESIFHKWM